MTSLLDKIHPAYRTDRRDYWLVCLVYFAINAGLRATAIYAGQALSKIAIGSAIAVAMFTGLLLLLITIRRLRDTGVSTWWALLFVFPINISMNVLNATLDLPTFAGFTPAPLSVALIDFQPLIACLPIICGLMKPTQSEELQPI